MANISWAFATLRSSSLMDCLADHALPRLEDFNGRRRC